MMTLLLVVIYLAFISLGLPDSLLGSGWPEMRASLALPLSAAGLLSMITTSGTILSSFLSVRLIRRFGTGIVTAVSVLLTAVALMGIASSRQLWALCLMSIPLGLGAGSVDAALNNFVALKYEARHMNWLHCFWGLGASLSPLIMARSLAGSGGWRGGYLTVGLLQTALVAVLFLSIPLFKRASSQEGAAEERARVLSVGQVARIPGAALSLLSFFLYCAAEGSAGLWGASFLTEARGFDPGSAARWVSLYYGGITAGRLLAGFLAGMLDNLRLIRLGLALALLGALMIVIPSGTFWPCAGLALFGLGCAPIFPALLHETPARFGKENSQAIIGMQMAFAYMGSTLMPPLFGLLANWTSPTLYPFWLILMTALTFCASEGILRAIGRRTVH